MSARLSLLSLSKGRVELEQSVELCISSQEVARRGEDDDAVHSAY